MSQLFYASLPDLTVLQGGTASREINCLTDLYDAEAITVKAPASIDGKNYTWEGSIDDGATWATIHGVDGLAIGVPAINTMITYNGIFTGLTNLRLLASSAVSADISFQMAKATRA